MSYNNVYVKMSNHRFTLLKWYNVIFYLCVTGNTISGITGFTGAPESTIQISAIRIFVAIMTLSITFIDINTTFQSLFFMNKVYSQLQARV